MKKFLVATVLLLSTIPAHAIEVSAGKYKHRFDDGTCGVFTVDANSKFTKYGYGPCGRAPTYTSNKVRVRGRTIKVGSVTISKVEVSGRCFAGLWKFKQWRIPNKKFCR